MDFRKGDRITVEGVVSFVSGDRVYFNTKSQRLLDAESGDVTLVSTHFELEDVVTFYSENGAMLGGGTVKGVADGWLWLDLGTNGRVTVEEKLCKLAQPPQPEPPAPPPEPAHRLYGVVPRCETSPQELIYVTAIGDTLEALASEFETSVDTIRVLNPHLELNGTLSAGLPIKVNDNRIPF